MGKKGKKKTDSSEPSQQQQQSQQGQQQPQQQGQQRSQQGQEQAQQPRQQGQQQSQQGQQPRQQGQQQRPRGQQGQQQGQQQRPQSQQQHGQQGQQQRPPGQQQQRPQSQQQHGQQGQQQRPPGQQQAWPDQQQQQRPQNQPQPDQSQQQRPAWPGQQQQQRPPGQQQAWPGQQQQQRPPGQQQAWPGQQQQQRPPGQQQAWPGQQQQQRPPGQQQAWPGQQQQQRPPGQQQQGRGPAWGQKSETDKQGQTATQEQQSPITEPSAVSPTIQEPIASVQETTVSSSQQSSVPQTTTVEATPISEMSMMSLSDMKIPVRKNPNVAGTAGQKITVHTNMMEINFNSKFPAVLYHYDVDITPLRKKYLYRRVFLEALKKLFPKNTPIVPFDARKNAYTGKKLAIKEGGVTIDVVVKDDDNRDNPYKVNIKEVNQIDARWVKNVRQGLDLTEQHFNCIQALNIILSNGLAHKTFPLKRSYFVPPSRATSLGGGLDLWIGLFQSVNIGWKPFLNVDVSHKGFFKEQSLMDLVKVVCFEQQRKPYGNQPPPPSPQSMNLTIDDIRRKEQDIHDTIADLRVSLYLNNTKERSRQKVRGLAKTTPANHKFDLTEENGTTRTITVQQYYQEKKRYRVQYPNLPCVILQNGAHVPLEVCHVEIGQTTDNEEIERKVVSNMIKAAATNTTIRKQKIMDTFKAMQQDSDPCLKEFDISINGSFAAVPARILDPPQLCYHQDKVVRVQKGVWRSMQFKETRDIIAATGLWSIVNVDRYIKSGMLYDLARIFRDEAGRVGMHIGEAKTPFEENVRATVPDLNAVFKKLKIGGVRFVIVIIPDQRQVYATVKQVAELNVGILTQCLKSNTVQRKILGGDMSTVNNILQKVNAKLNGVNHYFNPRTSRPKCLERPCMIVGADVTHPSPKAKSIPSIAAVVASQDPNAQFKYNVQIRLQPPRKETIVHLQEIMKIQLMKFYQATGQKPHHIIFYRDGVGEGHFREIMIEEIMAIRRACASVQADGKYKPPITFLVVQKRHHTRLFPTREQDSDDRNFNVKAGTIVDTVITHPSQKDFYLVSHASIQGTARPTKYRCLWDDLDMPEDEIEQLTYYLCHMFSRCSRSVSYPAPTYYAHLAAFRARHLISNVPIDVENLEEEQRKKLNINNDIFKTPMFFV